MKRDFVFRENKKKKYECYMYGHSYPSVVLNSKEAAQRWVELFQQWDKLKSVFLKLCDKVGIDEDIIEDVIDSALRKKITAEQYAEQMQEFALQSFLLFENSLTIHNEILQHEKTNKVK